MSLQTQTRLGWAAIIIGIIVMAGTLFILFVPSSYLPVPAIYLGVTTIISIIAMIVAFSVKGSNP